MNKYTVVLSYPGSDGSELETYIAHVVSFDSSRAVKLAKSVASSANGLTIAADDFSEIVTYFGHLKPAYWSETPNESANDPVNRDYLLLGLLLTALQDWNAAVTPLSCYSDAPFFEVATQNGSLFTSEEVENLMVKAFEIEGLIDLERHFSEHERNHIQAALLHFTEQETTIPEESEFIAEISKAFGLPA